MRSNTPAMLGKGKEQLGGNRRNWSTADFYFGTLLGEGLFGKVYFAKFKERPRPDINSREPLQFSPTGSDGGDGDGSGGDYVAIKVIDKVQITKKNKQHSVIRERQILSKMTSINSPWIIPLYMSFVDKYNLYMVMGLGVGGTLHALVVTEKQKLKLDDVSIKYYCGQIVCALEYLHSHDIYHCDLKPQNVVIGNQGRIRLIDFDCAIDLSERTCAHRTNEKNGMRIDIEFAGTADYVAPEVMKGSVLEFEQSRDTSMNTALEKMHFGTDTSRNSSSTDTDRHCFASIDLWSYGCLVYFMFASQSPFHTESDYKTMQRILSFANNTSSTNHKGPSSDDCLSNANEDGDGYISWTDEIPTTARGLVEKLLVPNPFLRLGMDNIPPERKEANEIMNYKYDSIRMHDFFQNLDWDSTENASTTENQSIVLPKKIKVEEQLKNHMIDGANSIAIMEHFL